MKDEDPKINEKLENGRRKRKRKKESKKKVRKEKEMMRKWEWEIRKERERKQKRKEDEKKNDEEKRKGLMWHVVCAFGSVLMCLDITWYDPLWLVLSWCVRTKPDVTLCDWFCHDVFGPNLMWPIVIGLVLMCLDQTWCDPLCWCDLIAVKNLKDSKKFQSSKEEFKTSRRMSLKKKKFIVRKRLSKIFKWEIGT